MFTHCFKLNSWLVEVSEEARMIFWLSTGLCSKIREKSIEIDSDTTDVLKESLVQKIENFELLLQNEAVRGHLDPSFRSPIVHNRSSLKKLLIRLHRQVEATCVLVDVCYLGPPPNAEEQAVIAEVKNGLNLLDEAISPVSSLEGSATESD